MHACAVQPTMTNGYVQVDITERARCSYIDSIPPCFCFVQCFPSRTASSIVELLHTAHRALYSWLIQPRRLDIARDNARVNTYQVLLDSVFFFHLIGGSSGTKRTNSGLLYPADLNVIPTSEHGIFYLFIFYCVQQEESS